MKNLKEILENNGYELKSYYISDTYSSIIAYKGELRVYINKTYKGYKLKAQEWLSDSFGRRSEFESTKCKEILEFLKRNCFI